MQIEKAHKILRKTSYIFLLSVNMLQIRFTILQNIHHISLNIPTSYKFNKTSMESPHEVNYASFFDIQWEIKNVIHIIKKIKITVHVTILKTLTYLLYIYQ